MLSAVGCASTSAPVDVHPMGLGAGVGTGIGQVPEGPGWPGWIAPAMAAKAVDFRGTCTWGRSAGKAERYQVRVRIVSFAVAVRADARFDEADSSNVIGELSRGVHAFADGPVYGGYGMGYAVPVRGHTGRVCRGYIPAAAVVPENLHGSASGEAERRPSQPLRPRE